jgi:hypothetical protein
MANEGLLIVFEQCAHDALDSSGLELNAGPIFAKRAVGAGAFGDRHYLIFFIGIKWIPCVSFWRRNMMNVSGVSLFPGAWD